MKKVLIISFLFLVLSPIALCSSILNVYTSEEEHPLQKVTPDKKLPKIVKCGYRDNTNKIAISAQYQQCGNFKNNQATVMISGYDIYPDGAYNLYCINPSGEKIHKGACKGFSGLFSEDEKAMKQMMR